MSKRNVNGSSLWGVALSVSMALISSVVMSLIFALILNKSGAGEGTQSFMAIIIWIISIILGNAVLSLIIREKKIMWILIVSITYCAILAAIQILLFDGIFSGIWKGMLSLIGGIIVSVWLFSREKGRKKRKIHYRSK